MGKGRRGDFKLELENKKRNAVAAPMLIFVESPKSVKVVLPQTYI